MARFDRRRASAGAYPGLGRVAADRRRPRQLCAPGRVAERHALGYKASCRGEFESSKGEIMTPGLLTPELFWLTLTVILTGLLWVPYILNRLMVRGLGGAMANPSRNDKPHAPWATRLMFAHDNAIENLAVFAPLVLILNAIDYSSNATAIAC